MPNWVSLHWKIVQFDYHRVVRAYKVNTVNQSSNWCYFKEIAPTSFTWTFRPWIYVFIRAIEIYENFTGSDIFRSHCPRPLTADAKLSQGDLLNITDYLVTNRTPAPRPLHYHCGAHSSPFTVVFLKEVSASMTVEHNRSDCVIRALCTSWLFSRTSCEQPHLRSVRAPRMLCCGLEEVTPAGMQRGVLYTFKRGTEPPEFPVVQWGVKGHAERLVDGSRMFGHMPA